eukprot:g63140.t1
MIQGVIKRRRLDRLARRESPWLPGVVLQLITDYLYRREDVAALQALWREAAARQELDSLAAVRTVGEHQRAKAPARNRGRLQFCSLVVSAEATSFGFCANLCLGARGPLDPPSSTCTLAHLSIEAGHEAMLSQACEFLSRATFPRLETLRLAYTGRTSAALETRLPTLGLQRSRLPRLKLMFLGPLPTTITGTIPTATELVFTGAVGYGSCLDRL